MDKGKSERHFAGPDHLLINRGKLRYFQRIACIAICTLFLSLAVAAILNTSQAAAQGVTLLPLGEPVDGTLSARGDSNYYWIEMQAGEHLFIILDSASDLSNNELYIRYGKLPSRDEYDDRYDLSAESDQAAEIVDTPAGYYYVLVYGSYVSPQPCPYTITADSSSTMVSEGINDVPPLVPTHQPEPGSTPPVAPGGTSGDITDYIVPSAIALVVAGLVAILLAISYFRCRRKRATAYSIGGRFTAIVE
jgi:hypothetical protein